MSGKWASFESGKITFILEKSWKNHGKSTTDFGGHPVGGELHVSSRQDAWGQES